MQFSIAAALGFAAFAYAVPQGVTQNLSPDAGPPDGCTMSYDQGFHITTVNATTASKHKRAMGLTIKLNNGVLMDQDGNTGYIAANYQFQFDSPPQTGAIYTAGFSHCANGTLALGGSAVFYSCNSGDFNNLYDRNYAPQCSAVYISTIPSGGSTGGSMSMVPSASAMSDGQPIATSAASELPDNQPQAMTSAVSQISDNQPQAMTSAAAGVSQISDNQPQAMTSAAAGVSQISDNQPQAMTSAAAGVSQIGDNQPQAMTTAASPISQINDNQPQAATSAARVAGGNSTMPSRPIYSAAAPIATAAPMAMLAGAFFAALL